MHDISGIKVIALHGLIINTFQTTVLKTIKMSYVLLNTLSHTPLWFHPLMIYACKAPCMNFKDACIILKPQLSLHIFLAYLFTKVCIVLAKPLALRNYG